jgi:hypothetical protein
MLRGLPRIVDALCGRPLASGQHVRAFFAAACLAGLVFGVARVQSADVPTPGSKRGAQPTQRLREGAVLVDVPGYFKTLGDRTIFYPLEHHVGYTGLENLSLERVASMLNENLDQMVWSVSGTITEFRGANFILISKAVLKGRVDPLDVAGPRPRPAARGVQEKTGAKSAR